MALWTRLLFAAGKRLASDERVRAKVAGTYRDEVRPRAEAAWAKTKPKIDETRADIRRIADETPPKRNPGRFAGRVARTLIDRAKGRNGKDG
jgi:hypothetical protein